MEPVSLQNSILGDMVDLTIACLEKGLLTDEEIPPIATYALEKIEEVRNEEDAERFLKEVSEKWPIFSSLSLLAEGHRREKVEGEVAEDVLHLAQSGKIDEALSMAKNTTQN